MNHAMPENAARRGKVHQQADLGKLPRPDQHIRQSFAWPTRWNIAWPAGVRPATGEAERNESVPKIELRRFGAGAEPGRQDIGRRRGAA
jgi:hypothetical protein